jgi:hypothetical protein
MPVHMSGSQVRREPNRVSAFKYNNRQMTVGARYRARIIQLLLADVHASLGPGYAEVVHRNSANVAPFATDALRFRDKLVEDVQQYFHDCFIDTTWPACPRHRKHPLWLVDEFWCCLEGAVCAKLGELSSIWTGRAYRRDPRRLEDI